MKRRTFIGGAGVVGLGAIAGCTFRDDPGTPGAPSTPRPTGPTSDGPDSSVAPDPSQYRDGSGKAGPGARVSGRRGGLLIEVSPTRGSTGVVGADTRVEAVVERAFGTTARSLALTPLGFGSATRPIWSAARSPAAGTPTNRGSVAPTERSCVFTTEVMEAGATENLVINPNSSRIYPGAMFDINSVWQGTLVPVDAPRAPIRISTSIPANQLDGSSSRVVTDPSLSSVRDVTNDIVRSVKPGTTTAAQMGYDLHRVYDKQQVKVLLGANYDGLTTDITANFDFRVDSETTKLVARFLQKYYSLDIDIPNAFFADGRTPAPTDAIVSSVSYGRLLLFSAESKATATDVAAALDAAFNGLVASGGASLRIDYERILRETTLRVTVIGGSGTAGAELITNGYQGLKDFILDEAEFSPTRPAYPLSYQISYLSDFALARVDVSTEYQKPVCTTTTTGLYRVHNFKLFCEEENDGDAGLGTEEIIGRITVSAYDGPRQVFDSVVAEWDDPVDVTMLAPAVPVPGNALVDFGDLETVDLNRAYIEVTADLEEEDTFSNDDLFGGPTRAYLYELSADPDPSAFDESCRECSKYRKLYTDGGTRIWLSFDITPL